MLAVASAYSGLLDLCLYFYCLCLLLSCSVVTPPNLVVVVGGVTLYLIHVINGHCTKICVQCHLQKYLHGSKKAWIMHGKDGL
jgi:hypothetical protein